MNNYEERLQHATSTVLSQGTLTDDSPDIWPEHTLFISAHPGWLSVSALDTERPIGFAAPNGQRMKTAQFMGRDPDYSVSGLDIYLYYKNYRPSTNAVRVCSISVGGAPSEGIYRMPGDLADVHTCAALIKKMRAHGASSTNPHRATAYLTGPMIAALDSITSKVEVITTTHTSTFRRPCDDCELPEGCTPAITANCSWRMADTPCNPDECGIARLVTTTKGAIRSEYTEVIEHHEVTQMYVPSVMLYKLDHTGVLPCYRFNFPMGIPKEFICTCLLTDIHNKAVYVPQCLLGRHKDFRSCNAVITLASNPVNNEDYEDCINRNKNY